MSQEKYIMAIDQGTTSSRAIYFQQKRRKGLARVKKSLLRFSLRQVGLSTMLMKFGTQSSQLLRVLSSKVVSSQINRSHRDYQPT